MRYYRWALGDFRREIQEDFPFLRRIKGRASLRLLAAMEPLRREEQIRFSVALVKRFHPQALEVTGEYSTIEENELIRGYVDSILVPTRKEQEIDRQIQEGSLRLEVNKKELADLIKAELQPILGSPSEVWGPGEWWYVTPIANWSVRTSVNVAGKSGYQLDYHHRVGIVAPPRYLVQWTSVLSWLGISSQTIWDLLTKSDASEAARTLALLCSHFIQAVPGLLEGLMLD